MLYKGFLHTNTQLFKIPRQRFYTGLFAGLFFSFCMYALFYMTRESFRILSLTPDYDMWILTDTEVSFYNLIFAFISLIFGQSICFDYWFNHSLTFFSKRKYQRHAILNQQQGLNTYFLFWFSKLAILYGIYFGWTLQAGFYTFSLYPKYSYIFILIVIVLVFQTWNRLRRINPKQSLRWMFISILSISILSFSISKINLIPYKIINNIALSKNIPYRYNLQLPQSDIPESKSENQNQAIKIYVVLNQATPQIYIHQQQVSITQLADKIKKLNEQTNTFDSPFVCYQLYIDKSINMKWVNMLKSELAQANAFRIAYAYVPAHTHFDKRFYKNTFFKTHIAAYNTENKTDNNHAATATNIIEIKHTHTNRYLINNQACPTQKLKQTLYNIIKRQPNYLIQFQINDQMIFSDYFSLISAVNSAIYKLRNEKAMATYHNTLEDLEYNKANLIYKQYPIRIVETKPVLPQAPKGDVKAL